MSDLIPIANDSQFSVSARDLYDFVQSKAQFTDWCKRMIDYGFQEGIDFITNLCKSSGGRPSVDYLLTLDCAKEIAMIQRTERGKQARQYFIEVERRYKQMQPAQLSPAEQLLASAQLLVQQEQRMKALEATSAAMSQQIAIVEARQIDINRDYFTLAGYYGLKKRRFDLSPLEAQRTGKLLKARSNEQGYEVHSEYSGKYGKVNTYHIEILKSTLLF